MHTELSVLESQIAAFEATKGTKVIVSGDSDAAPLELRTCIETVRAKLMVLAKRILTTTEEAGVPVTYGRYASIVDTLLARCDRLIAVRYPAPHAEADAIKALADRIHATVTPEATPDGR